MRSGTAAWTALVLLWLGAWQHCSAIRNEDDGGYGVEDAEEGVHGRRGPRKGESEVCDDMEEEQRILNPELGVNSIPCSCPGGKEKTFCSKDNIKFVCCTDPGEKKSPEEGGDGETGEDDDADPSSGGGTIDGAASNNGAKGGAGRKGAALAQEAETTTTTTEEAETTTTTTEEGSSLEEVHDGKRGDEEDCGAPQGNTCSILLIFPGGAKKNELVAKGALYGEQAQDVTALVGETVKFVSIEFEGNRQKCCEAFKKASADPEIESAEFDNIDAVAEADEVKELKTVKAEEEATKAKPAAPQEDETPADEQVMEKAAEKAEQAAEAASTSSPPPPSSPLQDETENIKKAVKDMAEAISKGVDKAQSKEGDKVKADVDNDMDADVVVNVNAAGKAPKVVEPRAPVPNTAEKVMEPPPPAPKKAEKVMEPPAPVPDATEKVMEPPAPAPNEAEKVAAPQAPAAPRAAGKDSTADEKDAAKAAEEASEEAPMPGELPDKPLVQPEEEVPKDEPDLKKAAEEAEKKARASAHEAAGDAIDAVKAHAKAAAQETAKAIAQDTAKETAKETARLTAQETAKETATETATEVAKKVVEEELKQATDRLSAAASKDAENKAEKEAEKEAAAENAQAAAVKAAKEVAESIAKKAVEDAQAAAAEAAEAHATEVAEEVATQVAIEVANKTAEATTKALLDKFEKEDANSAQERGEVANVKRAAKEAAQEAAEEVAKDAAKDATKEALHKAEEGKRTGVLSVAEEAELAAQPPAEEAAFEAATKAAMEANDANQQVLADEDLESAAEKAAKRASREAAHEAALKAAKKLSKKLKKKAKKEEKKEKNEAKEEEKKATKKQEQSLEMEIEAKPCDQLSPEKLYVTVNQISVAAFRCTCRQGEEKVICGDGPIRHVCCTSTHLTDSMAINDVPSEKTALLQLEDDKSQMLQLTVKEGGQPVVLQQQHLAVKGKWDPWEDKHKVEGCAAPEGKHCSLIAVFRPDTPKDVMRKIGMDHAESKGAINVITGRSLRCVSIEFGRHRNKCCEEHAALSKQPGVVAVEFDAVVLIQDDGKALKAKKEMLTAAPAAEQAAAIEVRRKGVGAVSAAQEAKPCQDMSEDERRVRGWSDVQRIQCTCPAGQAKAVCSRWTWYLKKPQWVCCKPAPAPAPAGAKAAEQKARPCKDMSEDERKVRAEQKRYGWADVLAMKCTCPPGESKTVCSRWTWYLKKHHWVCCKASGSLLQGPPLSARGAAALHPAPVAGEGAKAAEEKIPRAGEEVGAITQIVEEYSRVIEQGGVEEVHSEANRKPALHRPPSGLH